MRDQAGKQFDPEMIALFDAVQDELARHPDAVVIMPRLNLGEFYGPSLKGMNTVIQPRKRAT